MKKRSISIIFVFFVLNLAYCQTLNLEMDSETSEPFLLGKIDKSGLTAPNYNLWFSTAYDAYEPNNTIIAKLRPLLKDYQITVFMGTWCGDSKQEVPRFYKILEACDFPETQLTTVAVSRKPYMYKQSPNHEEAGLNIHRVPTFIFYKNRKEVNRIVEHPVEDLESDMLQIVSNNAYQSNYMIVNEIHSILKLDGINGLKASAEKLTKSYAEKVTSMYELNTYGRVLYHNNHIDEAIEVFRLNTRLFPEIPNTYMSLANTLGISGRQSESIEVLENALHRFPKNEDLIENLDVIKSN
ncbi:hypothetical protein ACU8DI_13945 [Psychroserpens sp. BH13MA-6]